jgi:hypothetical protein
MVQADGSELVTQGGAQARSQRMRVAMTRIVLSPTRKTKRQRPRADFGQDPNLQLHALSQSLLVGHASYQPLNAPVISVPAQPEHLLRDAHRLQQRSPAWHIVRRGLVTASVISQLLGFFHPGCREALGGDAAGHSVDDAAAGIAYGCLGVVAAPTDSPSVAPYATLAMQWGANHEPNGLMALLSSLDLVAAQLLPQGGTGIAQLRLEECGLSLFDQSMLPAPLRLLALPKLGASLDGMLTIAGQKLAAVEVKCPFPFVDDHRAGYYKYIGRKARKFLPARVFAQCQFQMLVTGTSACVLVEWHVTDARATIMKTDCAWCEAALRALSACWQHATAHKSLPPFGTWAVDESKELCQLLALTKAACRKFADGGTIALRLSDSLGPRGSLFN